MEVFLQKEANIAGAHKIGAAISGPRIAGENFTDMRGFLEKLKAHFVSVSFVLVGFSFPQNYQCCQHCCLKSAFINEMFGAIHFVNLQSNLIITLQNQVLSMLSCKRGRTSGSNITKKIFWSDNFLFSFPKIIAKENPEKPKGGQKRGGGGGKPHGETPHRKQVPTPLTSVRSPPFSISLMKSLRNPKHFPQVTTSETICRGSPNMGSKGPSSRGFVFRYRFFLAPPFSPWSRKPGLPNGCLANCEIGGCKATRQPFANPLPTLCQPFANPSPTLRQPFANPSPTLRQPFASPLPTFSANPSPSPSFRGPQALVKRHKSAASWLALPENVLRRVSARIVPQATRSGKEVL